MNTIFPTEKKLHLLMLLFIALMPFRTSALQVGTIIEQYNLKFQITYLDDRDESKSEVTVIGLTSNNAKNLYIPDRISVLVNPDHYWYWGFKVTAISSLTAEYNKIIDDPIYGSYIYTRSEAPIAETITIPETVTSIDPYVFNGLSNLSGMSNLSEIIVDPQNPNYSSINGILYNKDVDSLLFCPKAIKGVEFPATLKNIPDKAFANCKSLTSINIPSTIDSIGKGVFERCTNLSEINVDPGNKNYVDIDGILFNKELSEILAFPLAAITEYAIPQTVKEIPESAFYGCESLTSISLSDGITSIKPYTFYGCTSLTNVYIPSSVTSIGKEAFYNCSSIVSLKLPDSVTDIGEEVFYGCSGLTDVIFPPSITSIPNYSFTNCSSLLSISLPQALTEIGTQAFSDCHSIKFIDIPSSVTKIYSYAFSDCSSLTHVNIPNVSSIDLGVFYGCASLTNVVIPESVTYIDNVAFSHCESLTSVTIPGSVKYISNAAFRRCSSLSSVTISNGVEKIFNEAFYLCTSLSEITLPNSISHISTKAFLDCTNLLTIKSMNPTPPSAYESSFENVPVSADVYVPKGSAQYYTQAPGWSRFYDYHEVDEWEAGISDISADTPDIPRDVYTPQGICVKRGATNADVNALPKGLYIVGGRKVYVN